MAKCSEKKKIGPGTKQTKRKKPRKKRGKDDASLRADFEYGIEWKCRTCEIERYEIHRKHYQRISLVSVKEKIGWNQNETITQWP